VTQRAISFTAELEGGFGLACGWRRSLSEATFGSAKRSQIWLKKSPGAAGSCLENLGCDG
jgi:hypothetical protein